MRDADWRSSPRLLFTFLGLMTRGLARLVAAPPGAAATRCRRAWRSSARKLAARGRRARAARGPARLLHARRARAAGLAPRDPAHRRAVYRACATAAGTRGATGRRRAAPPGARAAPDMRRLLLRGAALAPLIACGQPPLAAPARSRRPTPSGPRYRRSSRELVQRHGFVEKRAGRRSSRASKRDRPVLQLDRAAGRERAVLEGIPRASCSPRSASPAGGEFWTANRAALARAEREFGVPGANTSSRSSASRPTTAGTSAAGA